MKSNRVKNKIFLVFLGLFLMGPAVSQAACSAVGCTDKIIKIYLSSSSGLYVQMAGDLSLVNCTKVSGVYFTLKDTHQNYNKIYAALLLAKATDTPINLRISEGSADCQVSYATY